MTSARYKMSAGRSLEMQPIILCRSKLPVDLTGKMGAQEFFLTGPICAQNVGEQKQRAAAGGQHRYRR